MAGDGMVVTKIQAGLGNQMFQYAMGRAVAHRLGADLKLDVSGFRDVHERSYELERFGITAQAASMDEIRAMTGILGRRNGERAKGIRRLCSRLGLAGRLVTGPYVWERHFHFDPTMLYLGDGVYLHGRWQSEKYFCDIADIIRDEFQLKSVPDEDQGIGQRMEGYECSVSLHVRRGDYVTLSQQGRVYTILPVGYYETAVTHMRAKLRRPQFFIFSDEPLWVQNNLHIEDSYVVNLTGSDRGPRELLLMSKCRHHIIANSTFSWWGAWLCPRRDSIVCAPKQWFAPESQQKRCMGDLLPSTWVTL
jgi:hypothetical protein